MKNVVFKIVHKYVYVSGFKNAIFKCCSKKYAKLVTLYSVEFAVVIMKWHLEAKREY